MRKSNLALLLGVAVATGLLGGTARGGRSAELSVARAAACAAPPRAAAPRQPENPAMLGQPERLSQATELACFSDGVSCAHALECCSGGCSNGQCGPHSKSKRRLARR
jgi:hypothetical protein